MIRLGPVDGLASSLKGWRDVVSPSIFSGPFLFLWSGTAHVVTVHPRSNTVDLQGSRGSKNNIRALPPRL